MDQVDGSNDKDDNTNANPPVVPWGSSLHSDQEEDAHTGHPPKHKVRSPQSPTKGYWQQLWHEKPDRHIELALTVAISFFALAQLIVSCSNNASTSQQTDQLIMASKYSAYAANQNAQASRNFAGSAEGINQEMRDAVGKLGLQAQRMEDARQTSENNSKSALDAAIRQSRLDQRGWVGFSNFTFVIADGKPLKGEVRVNVTGKTPVVDVQSRTTINWFIKSRNPVLVDLVYDPAAGGFIKHGTAMPGNYFPLDSAEPEPVSELGKQIVLDVLAGGRNLYFFGESTYRDIFRDEHWTHFCMIVSKEHLDGVPCPFYNDSDADYQKKN